MALVLHASLEGVLEACLSLGDALEEELGRAAVTASVILAETAKREHWYENQTKAAENNTLGVVPPGEFLANTLAFGAMIDTDYGEYLEARAPVLGHAWLLTEGEIEGVFDAGLSAAADRAPGWRAG